MEAVVIKVVEDDHGHATLMVHGEPDFIMELAQILTLILASEAEQVILPDGELPLPGEDEEDLGSSS